MARPCSVCQHPASSQRSMRWLLAGRKSIRDIASVCPGSSKSSIARHAVHLIPATPPLPTASEGGLEVAL